jgi:hypothetical protein
MKGLLIVAIALLAGVVSCGEKTSNEATGTIIGSYSNGFISLLVLVDERYPIGKAVEHVATTGDCWSIPNDSTYSNMIQVQGLGLRVGDKICFSYRAYDPNNIEYSQMFVKTAGNAYCIPPIAPIYVITDYQHLK